MLELNPTEANRPAHDQLPLSETKLWYRSPTEHFLTWQLENGHFDQKTVNDLVVNWIN
jgi:hypothetical protein